MGQTRFNNTFDDFRQKRKVGDRTVIGKLIFVQGCFKGGPSHRAFSSHRNLLYDKSVRMYGTKSRNTKRKPDRKPSWEKNYQQLTNSRLRSANTQQLAIPRTNTGYRDRSFAVSGPSVWSSLPTALWMSDCSFTTFRTELKTLLFIWYIVYRQLHFLTAGQRICGLLGWSCALIVIIIIGKMAKHDFGAWFRSSDALPAHLPLDIIFVNTSNQQH